MSITTFIHLNTSLTAPLPGSGYHDDSFLDGISAALFDALKTSRVSAACFNAVTYVHC